MLLKVDWRPGDVGPGLLSLVLEDQETSHAVEGRVRLDPWIADEYRLIEVSTGNCFVICGSPAVVVVDGTSLALLSSMSLEYGEGETIDLPWCAESEDRRFVLATERRVWCVDERGMIRWIWGCMNNDRYRAIVAVPRVTGDRVRVPLRNLQGDFFVDLLLSDGLEIAS